MLEVALGSGLRCNSGQATERSASLRNGVVTRVTRWLPGLLGDQPLKADGGGEPTQGCYVCRHCSAATAKSREWAAISMWMHVCEKKTNSVSEQSQLVSQVANLKHSQATPTGTCQPAAPGLPTPEVSCSFRRPSDLSEHCLLTRALKPALLHRKPPMTCCCGKKSSLSSLPSPLFFLIFLAASSRAPTFAVFSCWVHFPGLSVAAPLQPLPRANRPHRPVCLAARTGLPLAWLLAHRPRPSGIALGGALSLPGSRVPRTRCSAAA